MSALFSMYCPPEPSNNRLSRNITIHVLKYIEYTENSASCTLSHVSLCRPLSTYNSLQDKNLVGFFNNSRMRRHLRKSGLINRRGEIVTESSYRLTMARKEHQKHVRDLMAQAIVHKALDMERHRQASIKRKLEEIAKVKLVQRVRVSQNWRRIVPHVQLLHFYHLVFTMRYGQSFTAYIVARKLIWWEGFNLSNMYAEWHQASGWFSSYPA